MRANASQPFFAVPRYCDQWHVAIPPAGLSPAPQASCCTTLQQVCTSGSPDVILQMWFFNLPKDLRSKMAIYIYIYLSIYLYGWNNAASQKLLIPRTRTTQAVSDMMLSWPLHSHLYLYFQFFLNVNVKRMSEPSRHYTRTCRCTPTATSVTRSKKVLTSRPQHFFSAAGAKTKKTGTLLLHRGSAAKKGSQNYMSQTDHSGPSLLFRINKNNRNFWDISFKQLFWLPTKTECGHSPLDTPAHWNAQMAVV